MAYMLEWQRSTLKSGKPWNRWWQVPVYYTPINYCDLCGNFGPPKKVSTRNDVYGWNFTGPKDYTTKSKDMLCMGCWNKIRPLRKREREADELRTFINRLQRTISNERKQNHQILREGTACFSWQRNRAHAIAFVPRRMYTSRMADPRYAKNAGAVFSLKYHVVWCPKYRRGVLVPPIDARLKELLYETAAAHEMTVHALEVMPDHVHVFVETGPTVHVAEIANRLKGATSRTLREEFPSLRSRLPTLWSRSYFAATVGAVSEATIRRYIADQKGK